MAGIVLVCCFWLVKGSFMRSALVFSFFWRPTSYFRSVFVDKIFIWGAKIRSVVGCCADCNLSQLRFCIH